MKCVCIWYHEPYTILYFSFILLHCVKYNGLLDNKAPLTKKKKCLFPVHLSLDRYLGLGLGLCSAYLLNMLIVKRIGAGPAALPHSLSGTSKFRVPSTEIRSLKSSYYEVRPRWQWLYYWITNSKSYLLTKRSIRSYSWSRCPICPLSSVSTPEPLPGECRASPGAADIAFIYTQTMDRSCF